MNDISLGIQQLGAILFTGFVIVLVIWGLILTIYDFLPMKKPKEECPDDD